MLCIFLGPTKTIKQIKGQKPIRLIAGDCQKNIHVKVGDCEHDPAIQERKKGCFKLKLVKETLEQARKRISEVHRKNHLPFDPASVTDADFETKTVGETKLPTRTVFISPALRKDDGSKVTIDDFPDTWSFGNGVTCNSTVTLKDGSKRIMSWCVFPENMRWTVRTKYNTLRKIFEVL